MQGPTYRFKYSTQDINSCESSMSSLLVSSATSEPRNAPNLPFKNFQNILIAFNIKALAVCYFQVYNGG